MIYRFPFSDCQKHSADHLSRDLMAVDAPQQSALVSSRRPLLPGNLRHLFSPHFVKSLIIDVEGLCGYNLVSHYHYSASPQDGQRVKAHDLNSPGTPI